MSAEGELQFVDTNVLVYAHDRSAGVKYERGLALLESLWEKRLGCLSVQVLQEFYVVVTQKIPKPLEPAQAERILRDLAHWRVHAPNADDVLGAVGLQQRLRVSFWDAMVLWSAQQLGCATLWSEDLSPAQDYLGVRVVNPFLG